jgi:hypothetical protein
MITDLLHIPLAKISKPRRIKTADELSYIELMGMGAVAILISSSAAIFLGVA